MKILITGGAGCLGSNLIEHLLPKQHEIFALDNFETGKKEVLPLNIKGLTVFEGSVVDYDLMSNIFSKFKPDLVIHSAASYKDPSNWKLDVSTNVQGSINVAKLSEKNNVKRLINFQTALCYGRPIKTPIPINHRTSPFSSYGISKLAGESFILLSDVPSISIRLANITGPRLAIGPIPTFYKRLMAGQSCFCTDSSRDFLDMSDFLAFMDLAIDHQSPTGVYNLSSGESHSIKEIYDIVCNHLKIKNNDVPILPIGDDDVSLVCLDPSQTELDFNWRAKIDFENIILNQLNWYDKFGVNDVFSHLKSPKV